MSLVSAKDILDGKYAVGSTVTLAGWLRTRRDSKAGFSFLAINDGSCFNNVQVIADKSLNNYESEILSLTTGCSLVVEDANLATISIKDSFKFPYIAISTTSLVFLSYFKTNKFSVFLYFFPVEN